MFKKMLTLLLAAMMAITFMPSAVFAEDVEGTDWQEGLPFFADGDTEYWLDYTEDYTLQQYSGKTGESFALTAPVVTVWDADHNDVTSEVLTFKWYDNYREKLIGEGSEFTYTLSEDDVYDDEAEHGTLLECRGVINNKDNSEFAVYNAEFYASKSEEAEGSGFLGNQSIKLNTGGTDRSFINVRSLSSWTEDASYGAGDFTVTSSDDSVATGEIAEDPENGLYVLVTAVSEGETVLTVNAPGGETDQINVTVVAGAGDEPVVDEPASDGETITVNGVKYTIQRITYNQTAYLYDEADLWTIWFMDENGEYVDSEDVLYKAVWERDGSRVYERSDTRVYWDGIHFDRVREEDFGEYDWYGYYYDEDGELQTIEETVELEQSENDATLELDWDCPCVKVSGKPKIKVYTSSDGHITDLKYQWYRDKYDPYEEDYYYVPISGAKSDTLTINSYYTDTCYLCEVSALVNGEEVSDEIEIDGEDLEDAMPYAKVPTVTVKEDTARSFGMGGYGTLTYKFIPKHNVYQFRSDYDEYDDYGDYMESNDETSDDIAVSICNTQGFTVDCIEEDGGIYFIHLEKGKTYYVVIDGYLDEEFYIAGSFGLYNGDPDCDHTDFEWYIDVAPTCTKKGTETRWCSDCYREETRAISALGHKLVKVPAVAATCQSTGMKAYYECRRCGRLFTDAKGKKETTLAKLVTKKIAHSYKAKVQTEEYLKSAATCTKPAYYYYKCKTCDEHSTKTYSVGKALGHNYDMENPEIIKAATLKANGSLKTSCMREGCTTTTKMTIYKASNIKLSKTSIDYTGEEVKPTVIVRDSKKKDIPEAAYKLEWTGDPASLGEKTVKVVFDAEGTNGMYTGEKELTYTVRLSSAALSKLTAASKGFKAVWKEVSGNVDGYEIQYSTSSKFTDPETVQVEGKEITSVDVTDLAGYKTYYVRMRTYKTIDGEMQFSAWSAKKSIKTKK